MTIPHKYASTPGAAIYQDVLDELSKAIAPLQALHQQAVEALAPERSRDGAQRQPRCSADRAHTRPALGHACFPGGPGPLQSPLPRHYWTLDQQAAASYVHAYRELWDADDKNDTEEVQA